MQRSSLVDVHLRALIERAQPDFQRSEQAAALVRRSDFADALLASTNLAPMTDAAQRAYDYSSRVAQIYGRPANGIYVPLACARDLNVGLSTAGGNLVKPYYDASLQEAIRPRSIVLQAGARLIPGIRDGLVTLPKLDAPSQVHWADESTAPPQGDPSFAPSINITPRTLIGHTKYSRRLANTTALQSGFESAIFDDLFSSLWSEVDRVVLAGSGVGQQPMGILNNSDLNSVAVGTDGGPANWPLLTEMERVLGDGLGLSSPAWVTNTDVRKKLRNTRRAADLDYCWGDSSSMLGYDAHVTEHVPNDLEKGTSENLSALVLGDFSTVVLPIWGPAAVDVIVNPYTFANQGLVQLSAFLEIGVGFRHSKGFVVCKDIDTSE